LRSERVRAEQRAGSGPLADHGAELAAQFVRDVHERAERARGEERVARAPQDPARTRAFAERPHQRRLADPGLAGDEHQPPAPVGADRSQLLVECRQRGGALEELHAAGRRRVGHRHIFACHGPRRGSGRSYPKVKA
jgi:hypothetical protein